MTANTDPVRALIGQWRDAAEFFKGDAGSDIRETLMACARELEAALAPLQADFEAWAASIGFCVTGKYAETIDVLCAKSAFKAGYQAGRAALAQQPAAQSVAAASAEPAVWVAADTLNSPHPTCVSSLAYMSQLDRERGREYVPLYAAPQQPAAVDEAAAIRIDNALGVTKRELFTIAAMHTLHASDYAMWEHIAQDAVSLADATLAALAAQQQGGAE